MAFKITKPTSDNLFLVIDGSALVVTNFYGSIPLYIQNEKDIEKANTLCRKELRQTKNGTYTGAVASTIATILGLIRFYNPTHIAVCFDKSSKTTFRKQIYPAYKATRTPKPDALKEQMNTTRIILENIGIPAFWADKYEADDIAGSLIEHFKSECNKVLFVTKDHDWLQLIDHNVTGIIMQSSEEKAEKMRIEYGKLAPENNDAIDPFSPKTYRKCVTFNADVTYVSDGVYPKQIPDLKGLAGDASDNIPGAKGIGPGTAVPLLQYYHSIEGIYATIDKCNNAPDMLTHLAEDMKSFGIKRAPLQKLIDERDDVFLSRKLATIVTDIPISFTFDELKYCLKLDMLKKAVDYYELDEFDYLLKENV